MYATEYCVLTKKIELGLYVLTWSDVHDRISRQKYQLQNRVCSVVLSL